MISAANSQTLNNDFMQLLTVQLRHQNPLEPVKQENFIAQLAQFSTLEGIENLNANFASILQLQQVSQGVDLVGKQIEYLDPLDGSTKSGKVSEFFIESGNVMLSVNGVNLSVDRIAAVLDA